MDVHQTHALFTSSWLLLQSFPLFISPQFMVNLLAPAPRAATELETYFSRTLSLTLLPFALLPLLLTGLVGPVTATSQSSTAHTSPSADSDSDTADGPTSTSSSSSSSSSSSPYAPFTTLITTLHHTLALVYCYLTYSNPNQSNGSVALVLGMLGSGVLAGWGVLALIFGGEAGGGGGAGGKKRVSGWPFRNREEREAKREKMARRKARKGL